MLLGLRLRWALPDRQIIRDVVSAHWSFGRWGLGGSLAWWVRNNLYYLVLPIWGGLEASGAFRAMVNLIMPPMQVIGAVGPLLVSAFTNARSRSDFAGIVGKVALLLGVGTVAYWIVLGFLGERLLGWLYEGNYTSTAHLIWIIGLIPVCAGLGAAIGSALRALERPQYDFWIGALALLILVGGIPLVRASKVDGAVFAWSLSYLIATGFMIVTFARLSWRPVQGATDQASGS
jgi:O-antigen/teichoic acid export membrane protein